MHFQEHYLGCRRDAQNFLCGFEAVHDRHVDVQHDDIRLQLDDFFDGFFAVLGVTADLEGMPI